MKNIFDRLQIVKGLNPASDNGIFETREDAINYVLSKQVFERPSLVSEPIVLLYNNEENPKEPNVILAIGSVGDGKTASNNNRTFFIDTKKNEEDIEELYELIEEAVKSLTLIPLESDTIKLNTEKIDEGTVISGDVKIADYRIIDGNVVNNIIETEGEKGIFTFVDMDYDPDSFMITFKTTKATKEFKLPTDQHIVEGRYSTDEESIILKLADDSEVKIDVIDLINEWTVLPDSSTPVLLYREHVSANSEAHDGVYDWQDVLTADVRVASHIPNNIIQKDATGRYLYVKGTADNIKYSDDVTVKEAIDRIDTNVSSSNGNLIYKRQDGIYAYAMLDYNMAENKLMYSYSDGVAGGEVKTVEFKLNSIEILDDITYDPDREMIIIRYNTADGQHKTVEIPVKDIIEEWTVDNENHNIELSKLRDESRGKDLLSADVKIHIGDNNILEDKDHTLYVNGIADNIKYVATSNTTVKDAIDELKAEDSDISNVLDAEINRSTVEDTKINNTIGNGFSTDSHETVTYKFNELSGKVNSEADKLQAEIGRSEAKDTEHDGRLNTIDEEIGDGFDDRNTVRDEINKLQSEIDTVSADSSSRLSDVINEDESIDVETRDDEAGKPTIKAVKVNLSSEIEDAKANIIKLNADGLYAGVDLSYVEEANKLIFKTTNGTKEIKLESMSSIISINYDPNKEAIIITYMTNGHEVKTVEIPVGDLIREWKPSENTDGAIKLTLTEVPSGTTGKDILYGEVLISDHEDNILVNDGGSLYVSNASITANTAAINALEGRMDTAEADIDALENNLREEVSTRTLADEALGARIDQEIEDRIADVNAEQTRAEAAELAISNKIDADVLAEKNRATNAETALDTKIEQEIANREAAVLEEKNRAETAETSLFTKIEADVLAEKNRAVSAETALQEALNREIANREADVEAEQSRAEREEDTISHALTDEVSRSTAKDSEHDTNIAKNAEDIANEIVRAKANENVISGNVISEETRATSAETALRTAINNEVTRATSAEAALQTTIGNEATRAQDAENTLTSNITKEINDRKNEAVHSADYVKNEKAVYLRNINGEVLSTIDTTDFLIDGMIESVYVSGDTLVIVWNTDAGKTTVTIPFSQIFDPSNYYTKAEINSISGNLQTAISNEVARATSAENALDGKITTEVARATAAEASIQTQIDANKLEFHESTTIDLVKTAGNPSIVQGHVKIAASDNNIIRVDESAYGIYASVDLTYDSGTNTLTFKASDGTNKDIKLSSGSVIKRAWFDSNTEELVLEFENPDGSIYEVRVGVAGLVNQWDVDNTRSSGITLTKVASNSSSDLLFAKVNISQANDNALKLVDNYLYVSGSGITKALADTQTISGNVETLKTAVNGANGDYTYPVHQEAYYINSATSYNSADAILDKQLHILSSDIESLLSASGTATPSTVLRAESVGLNKVLKVDVTLSSGSTYPTMTTTGSIMTAGDLIITNYTGKHVEPGNSNDQSTREYSDTNVLRIAFVDGTDPATSTVDGVYLSNYWNCGKYYQASTEQTEIDNMVNEQGYLVSDYLTDEDGTARNYDYNNNVRQ